MKKPIVIGLFATFFNTISLLADDYDFDMDEIEVKSYEYGGYIRGENRLQFLNDDSPMYPLKDKSFMTSNLLESELNFRYFKDDFKFTSQFFANYQNIDGSENDTYSINQLFEILGSVATLKIQEISKKFLICKSQQQYVNK